MAATEQMEQKAQEDILGNLDQEVSPDYLE